jgi:hypothetical protein
MQFKISYDIHGWGYTIIEAESQEEAMKTLNEGRWQPATEDSHWEFDEIELLD